MFEKLKKLIWKIYNVTFAFSGKKSFASKAADESLLSGNTSRGTCGFGFDYAWQTGYIDRSLGAK